MKIQCTDKKTFELTDSSEKLGHITYDGSFSYEANAIVGEDSYKITPTGFFSTAISVTRNSTEVSNLKLNWKGHVAISFQDGQEFILKATGIFPNKFVLEDKDQQQLMLLNSDFNWAKFSITTAFHMTKDHKTYYWFAGSLLY